MSYACNVCNGCNPSIESANLQIQEAVKNHVEFETTIAIDKGPCFDVSILPNGHVMEGKVSPLSQMGYAVLQLFGVTRAYVVQRTIRKLLRGIAGDVSYFVSVSETNEVTIYAHVDADESGIGTNIAITVY